MFIEFVQYSLEKAKEIVRNLTIDRIELPISTSTNNAKCLDFDMDRVVFKIIPRTPIKFADVNPYNKSWLEVMDMV